MHDAEGVTKETSGASNMPQFAHRPPVARPGHDWSKLGGDSSSFKTQVCRRADEIDRLAAPLPANADECDPSSRIRFRCLRRACRAKFPLPTSLARDLQWNRLASESACGADRFAARVALRAIGPVAPDGAGLAGRNGTGQGASLPTAPTAPRAPGPPRLPFSAAAASLDRSTFLSDPLIT